MVYCLKIRNSNEFKVCIDADDKKSATRYFCKYEHLSKAILTQLFKVVPKKLSQKPQK
jgi:hypothetical protein